MLGCTVGALEMDGRVDGAYVVGLFVGGIVGANDGILVGRTVGMKVGNVEGRFVGMNDTVGIAVGDIVGKFVGMNETVGATVVGLTVDSVGIVVGARDGGGEGKYVGGQVGLIDGNKVGN